MSDHDDRYVRLPVDPKTLLTGATFWLVGKYVADTPAGPVWEFAGLFSTEELAAAQVPDGEARDAAYFIAPAVLNEAPPEERALWPGLYWPGEAER